MRFIQKNLGVNRSIFQGGLFLFGAIVGIGIFSLPFVVREAGLLKSSLAFFLASLIAWLINLAYARLVLVSGPGKNLQLANYGRHYWGWIGWVLGGLAILVNINGALLAYLIGAGNFLHLFFPNFSPFWGGLVFFLAGLPIVALKLKLVAQVNSAIVWLLILLIVIFLIWGGFNFNWANFFGSFRVSDSFFQIFSVFFFSFAGFTVVPELVEVMNFEEGPAQRAVAIGSFLPALLYVLFIIIGLGVVGDQVTEEFIFGLREISPLWGNLLSLVMIMAISSSFFVFGFTLKEFWYRDFGFGKTTSFILATLPVLVLYLLIGQNILVVISFTGAVSCLLAGGLIAACFLKEKQK